MGDVERWHKDEKKGHQLKDGVNNRGVSQNSCVWKQHEKKSTSTECHVSLQVAIAQIEFFFVKSVLAAQAITEARRVIDGDAELGDDEHAEIVHCWTKF